MIWAPLCLITRLGDLWCLQKLSFKILLAGPLGGSLASITQRGCTWQLCRGRKQHIGHGLVRSLCLENSVTPQPSPTLPHPGLSSCPAPTLRVSPTIHRLQLRLFMPSSLASAASRNLNNLINHSYQHASGYLLSSWMNFPTISPLIVRKVSGNQTYICISSIWVFMCHSW